MRCALASTQRAAKAVSIAVQGNEFLLSLLNSSAVRGFNGIGSERAVQEQCALTAYGPVSAAYILSPLGALPSCLPCSWSGTVYACPLSNSHSQ
eukprot:1157692-Pelagomonas_calceolata.AAC.6